jgi:hypothetical protein
VIQNIEVVAAKNPEVVTESELQARNAERDIGIELGDEIESYRRDEPTDDVPILTDDHAPVDSLLDPMVGQRYVIEQSPAENATAD